VDFAVRDIAEADQMDVFVFDSNGEEIASTVSDNIQYLVPAGALYLPSTKEFPNTTYIEASDFDGVWHPKLPTTVWIAVSDSGPAKAPGFSTYHLDVKVSGGKVEPVPGPGAPNPAPEQRPFPAQLPATGVGQPMAIPVSLIVGALLLALSVRPRRRTRSV
jgi:hypothetical protein